MPEVKDKLDQQGAIRTPLTPEQFRAFIKDDVQKWAKVVKASGATAE
jgi:tripartite-type tricarboxylate transporter receptor subunit TctC